MAETMSGTAHENLSIAQTETGTVKREADDNDKYIKNLSLNPQQLPLAL